jgi:hypothetical protein
MNSGWIADIKFGSGAPISVENVFGFSFLNCVLRSFERYSGRAIQASASYGIIGFSLIGQSTLHLIARLIAGEECLGYGIQFTGRFF